MTPAASPATNEIAVDTTPGSSSAIPQRLAAVAEAIGPSAKPASILEPSASTAGRWRLVRLTTAPATGFLTFAISEISKTA